VGAVGEMKELRDWNRGNGAIRAGGSLQNREETALQA